MILARLSRAIREQNWFAVALEFIIVIAGVVIGFQITAWNAERQERAMEAEILERLHQDFTELRESGENQLENSARQRALLTIWIEAGDANGRLDVDTLRALTVEFYRQDYPERADGLENAPARELLFESFSIGRTPQPSITFQQLVASGDLTLLQSQALRTALSRYDFSRVEAELAFESNGASATMAMRGDILAATWNAGAPGSEPGLVAIISDPGFIDWLRTMYAWNQYNHSWYQTAHSNIAPVITFLEDEMGGPASAEAAP